MPTIPESTPGKASPREHPALQRMPNEVEERLRPVRGLPKREPKTFRQESETKPIPTVPAPPPGQVCEPPKERIFQAAAGARKVSQGEAKPTRPS